MHFKGLVDKGWESKTRDRCTETFQPRYYPIRALLRLQLPQFQHPDAARSTFPNVLRAGMPIAGEGSRSETEIVIYPSFLTSTAGIQVVRQQG